MANQGQRHYAWRTPINLERDEYLVQMDEQPLKLVRRRWADLLHAVERCYRAGVPKAELEVAQVSVVRLGRLAEDPEDWEAWCVVEAAHEAGEVGALALAVWCAQMRGE